MKKIILATVAMMFVSQMAFAMGGKVPPQVSCLAKKEAQFCQPTFGDPWKPNFKYEVEVRTYSLDANGKLVVNFKKDTNGEFIPVPICKNPPDTFIVYGQTLPKPCYDPNKPTYDPQGYNDCRSQFFSVCQ